VIDVIDPLADTLAQAEPQHQWPDDQEKAEITEHTQPLLIPDFNA
jgi:hypothetical protein